MKATARSQLLANVRRAVIKVGNSVLADLPVARIRALAEDVAQLRKGGLEVVIVTSGSIDLGMNKLDLKRRPRQMPLLQAASAVGQVVKSRNPRYREGALVHGMFGWQEYFLTDGTPGLMGGVSAVPEGIPPHLVLSALGGTGLTA